MQMEERPTWEATMRTIRAALTLLVISLFATIDAPPSAAEIYRPWCAQYTGKAGARNCGFTSFEQCMMTATPGSGAHCVQNPWYLQYGSGGRRSDTAGRAERTRRY
jgi:hypothetical protein